ncbi:MAG TPA: TIGR03364 family FAD-dependent oxidoreductase, partial [Jatrophihabitans sp.]
AEWLRLAKQTGLWLRESGTVVLARAEDEFAVLEDFGAERGEDVVLLDRGEVAARVPVGEDVIGGAWLPRDLRVYPRDASAAIASWLESQGVRVHWKTSMLGLQGTTVRTTRGDMHGSRVVVCVGHDVDYLFPAVAEAHGVRRCLLHMLRVNAPAGRTIDPAVLTGFSLLRYDGFGVSPALASVRERLTLTQGGSIEAGLNLMYTQRPDGELTVGDTHDYGADAVPFHDEERDELVLRQMSALLGVSSLRVRERWQGVYASAPEPFLIAEPSPETRIVSVTTGIGMTTGLGLAAEVLDDLL